MGIDREASAVRRSAECTAGQGDADATLGAEQPESDEDKRVDADLERLVDLEAALEAHNREHASLSGSGAIDRALLRLAEEVTDGAED
jgi:hypothetical protein